MWNGLPWVERISTLGSGRSTCKRMASASIISAAASASNGPSVVTIGGSAPGRRRISRRDATKIRLRRTCREKCASASATGSGGR